MITALRDLVYADDAEAARYPSCPVRYRNGLTPLSRRHCSGRQ
jgi:hypothetical protein